MDLDNILEEWKDLPDEFSNYAISSIGRLKNKSRNSFLKPNKTLSGYITYHIKNMTKCAHILTAQTFIPNNENKPQIDHINRIRDDNRIENLRWVTHIEQAQNRTETFISGTSNPINQYDLKENFIREWKSSAEA